MVTKKLRLDDASQVIAILGVQDAKLRQLERELGIEIFVRHDAQGEGVDLSVRGTVSKVDKALARIRNILSGSEHAKPEACEKPASRPRGAPPEDIIYRPAEGKPVRARNAVQKEYIDAIFSHDLVLATGPAGTGKTFLAVAAALRAMETSMVERIVLTRPIVEAGERLGFLPGDLHEKVHPYLRPLYDAFYMMLGADRLRSWRDDGVVEIVPLAYMRGRTLENSFIILDEAQNTVPEQMKMFLTRMGLNSKVVITGDVTQIDLKDKNQSGLVHAMRVLRRVQAVKLVNFKNEDVVRHPLVMEIVKAYDDWESAAHFS
jgi:phosphate starvation-inducible PhoH-like protein